MCISGKWLLWRTISSSKQLFLHKKFPIEFSNPPKTCTEIVSEEWHWNSQFCSILKYWGHSVFKRILKKYEAFKQDHAIHWKLVCWCSHVVRQSITLWAVYFTGCAVLWMCWGLQPSPCDHLPSGHMKHPYSSATLSPAPLMCAPVL